MEKTKKEIQERGKGGQLEGYTVKLLLIELFRVLKPTSIKKSEKLGD